MATYWASVWGPSGDLVWGKFWEGVWEPLEGVWEPSKKVSGNLLRRLPGKGAEIQKLIVVVCVSGFRGISGTF